MAAIQGDWYASRSTHQGEGYPQSDDTVRFVYATQPNGEKYIVAKVWAGDDGDYEGTARLVAAAPAMLKALHLADSALDYAQAQVDSERDAVAIRSWRRDIQAAIAQAEVRSE
jgi:hypothetical protein